jgi:adenylate cyclase
VGKEIERKFLVRNDTWRVEADAGLHCAQGYLCAGPPVSVRVRIMGGKAMLNIKRAVPSTKGEVQAIERDEFEYPIPLDDADALLAGLCDGYPIDKTRHKLGYGGYVWEIDVFAGENAGLVVAEIELPSPDEPFARPPWLAEEVSHDPRYLNSRLSRKPFSQW